MTEEQKQIEKDLLEKLHIAIIKEADPFYIRRLEYDIQYLHKRKKRSIQGE